MMPLFIGLLTLVMVLDCIVLILLVLIQLPKKEAGAGLAFGGAASDALFGAGSGNVLTKVTKYAAIIFFVMAIILSILQSRYYYGGPSKFQQKLLNDTGGRPPAASPGAPSTAPATPPSTVPGAPGAVAPSLPTNAAAAPSTALKLLAPPVEATNVPPASASPTTPPK